ncbi:acyl carrier protein [Candidatus Dependentiae bacterium]|nr:acyl carrier protein [Candidatus Dependentiae bacterium]
MDLEKKIIKIIEENLEEELKVTLKTDLRDDLNIDSLSTLMIITALEDEFSITIKDTDFAEIKLVEDIIKLLKEIHPELGEG